MVMGRTVVLVRLTSNSSHGRRVAGRAAGPPLRTAAGGPPRRRGPSQPDSEPRRHTVTAATVTVTVTDSDHTGPPATGRWRAGGGRARAVTT
jgi:hypothetical protein